MPANSRIPFVNDYDEIDEDSQSNKFSMISQSFYQLNSTIKSSWLIRTWSNIISRLNVILTVRNPNLREFLAELFGTFFFISFGLGSVAQWTFSGYKSFLAVNLSFGLGLALAILVVGRISGGHLNPAVSLSMLLLGRISFVKLLLFTLAQFIGSFMAAAMIFFVYFSHIQNYKDGMYSMATAGIFATYPSDIRSTSTGNMFFDQFFSTSLFIITILGVTDKRNNDLANEHSAFLIGISLTAIGMSFGLNCGFAVNPTRDLAPRIFTSIAGWGSLPFTACNYFFWIPIVAPFIGSIFGTLLYGLFISNHWPSEQY
ncbi:unnamed protein product [Brachionus calyciflorus]|uniref:Uncharacterized protein n=1 Tax=Brachionus calyciflorus TaxID=104777 RepID=A0A814PHW3_9BILA|nr:unnamed protein product [Brachionus calyciflorus]